MEDIAIYLRRCCIVGYVLWGAITWPYYILAAVVYALDNEEEE